MSASLLQRVIRKFGPERVHAMLDADQRAALPWVWEMWARPEQLAPEGAWRWWNLIAGRGFGKTRSAAEWVRAKAAAMPGSIGAVIGQTPEEVRNIQIEGPAGILAVSPIGERPEWEPSKGLLTWPNGTVAHVHSGANPGEFRGPQFHWAWLDELAKWARAQESFDNLNFGLRLELHGAQPQAVISTTPRPIKVLRDLLKNPRAVTTRGSTYDNRANLAGSFLEEVLGQYEGTRLGDQELKGEMLDDTPGALWQRAMFEREGFRQKFGAEHFDLIAVAIDPSASTTEGSAETGIVVMGCFEFQGRRHFHVAEDASVFGGPAERARAAILAFQRWGATRLVVETNNGGDWIPALLATQWDAMGMPGACPTEVVTATRGKHTRAEPIAALYEQRRVTHAPGLDALEDQLTTWSPLILGPSPDRMDALVWAGTWLSTAKRVFIY